MKVLVMGGTRFNGLHLAYELVKQGHEVAVFNRGVTPAKLPPEVRRIQGDRKDASGMAATLSKQSFDAVFDVSAYTREDAEVMVKILEGRVAHYVFTSSTGVLGHSQVLPYTERSPLEWEPYISDYARNKIAAEEYLLSAYHHRGFPATIMRLAMVYGPHNMPQRELSYFARLLKRRPILIPDHGQLLLHNGHVDDQARAYLKILGNVKALGQVYHITGNECITQEGYVDVLAKIVGVEAEKKYVPRDIMDKIGTARGRQVFVREGRSGPEWEYHTVYDITKIRTDLGFEPEYTFERGHRQTFEWFTEEDMVEKLKFDFSLDDQVLKDYGPALKGRL